MYLRLQILRLFILHINIYLCLKCLLCSFVSSKNRHAILALKLDPTFLNYDMLSSNKQMFTIQHSKKHLRVPKIMAALTKYEFIVLSCYFYI